MKTQNRIFLAVSLIYTIIFLFIINHWYGMTPSISKNAKYLMEESKDILFYLFIFLNVGAFVWAGRSWISTIAGMLLFGIGIITGYSYEIPPFKLQSTIHVILTTSAIWLIMIEILRREIKQRGVLGYISVGIFSIFTLISFVSKYEYHTYCIEVCGFITAYIFYFVNPVNKKKRLKGNA